MCRCVLVLLHYMHLTTDYRRKRAIYVIHLSIIYCSPASPLLSFLPRNPITKYIYPRKPVLVLAPQHIHFFGADATLL
jgi:hypothetical protein